MDTSCLIASCTPTVRSKFEFQLNGQRPQTLLSCRAVHGGAAGVVNHHGFDADDVEHMAERYLDERPGGAVPPRSPSPPRPRCAPGGAVAGTYVQI